MSGPENLKGFDYQISYSIFRIFELIVNNYESEIDSIKFESMDENEEDFNIYWKNGKIEYIQIKKKNEGYSWTPTHIKDFISKYDRISSENTVYRFVTNAPANLDVKKLKKVIINNKLQTSKIIRQFRPSNITEQRCIELLKTMKFNTLYQPSDEEENPAKLLKKEIMSIINGPLFYVTKNPDEVYNLLWKYIYDKSRESEKLKFETITNFILKIGVKKLDAREWIRIPNIDSFSGRESDIDEIYDSIFHFSRLFIKGISGIGKTFISAKVAKQLDSENQNVCWISFNIIKDWKYVKSIFTKLMITLGTKSESDNLTNADDENIEIELITRFIREHNIFVFIDSYDKADISSKTYVKKLSEQFCDNADNGHLIVTTIDSFDLYSKSDIELNKAYEVNILEFSEDDFQNYFYDIKDKLGNITMKVLYNTIGGFPLTIVFFKQLILNGILEEYGIDKIARLSIEKRNKWIFDKIYSLFSPSIQALVSDLSVMNYSFSQKQVEALKISDRLNYKYELLKLSECSILVFNVNSFYMHDAIRSLAYDNLTDSRKVNAHNLLEKYYRDIIISNNTSNRGKHINISRWGYHIESIYKLDINTDLGINKTILNLSEQELSDLWSILLCGYPFEFIDDTLSDTENRISLLIKRKLIKKISTLKLRIISIKTRYKIKSPKYELRKFTNQDENLLRYLIFDREISNYFGYIRKFEPNFAFYKQFRTICIWEHCIENMPLENGESSCPMFGHNCPDGSELADDCKDYFD